MKKKPESDAAEAETAPPASEGSAPPASESPAPLASEDPAPPAQGGAAAQTPPPKAPSGQPLAVNAQYTKDFSFEAPAAPGVFMQMQKEAPDINVNVDVRARPFQKKNVYEVTLHIRAECKVGGVTGYLLELQYAGLFTLNVPENQAHPVLMIECPRFLFPFARNIAADATRDGGFPPMMLGPVDFAAMYRAQLKKQKTGADAEEGAKGSAEEGAEADAEKNAGKT